MANKDYQSVDPPGLRQWAEELAQRKSVALPENLAPRSSEEIQEMLHELRVHQIELEIQNEELRRTQAELEASRARLGDLYDYAPIGYVTESETGMVVEANLTAASLLGVPRGNLLRLALGRFVLPEDQDVYYHHRKRLLETGGPQMCELRMLRQGNPPFWARLEAIAAHDQGGASLFRVVLSDVTAYKWAEEERQRLKEQLARIEKMESIERLAGGVANDFNNTLAIILGNVEMALNHADPEGPFFANLQEISKAVSRSAHLTWQLFSFARMQTVAAHGLDLNEAVNDRLAMLRCVAGKNIELTWTPEPELWPVAIDITQVEQILVNLCNNARDAIVGKGQIQIEAKNVVWDAEHTDNPADVSSGEYVLLVVGDDGCGMAEEVMNKLFEPFYTTKRATERSVGLGLAIVYGIVKQNNGFINVYSEPGQGTVFKVYLPRHAAKTDPLLHVEQEGSAGRRYPAIDASGQPACKGKKTAKREITL